jgi:DNA repair exonuclease SbcCD nuclease subunit
MSLTVLNDWHIGAIRAGGTTPATAYQLRQDLLRQFDETLDNIHTDLLLNGDLFDGPAIPMADLLATFQSLSIWLSNSTGKLFGANGNHDLSKNSQVLSSYQLLMKLLIEVHGHERVTHIETGAMIQPGCYVVPHVANQDLFDVEIDRVPECDYLFVHANYDNGFAAESDHSLNLSKAKAEAVPAKTIVFGHEHQARIELGGKVVIVGNQFPSSVSDCLGNDFKQMFQIVDDSFHLPVTWHTCDDFSEPDWSNLEDCGRFIRVTGTATAAEAAQVVQTISRFRQQAKALVITNAVKVEGVNDQAELELSHEAIVGFKVHEALAKLLTDEENEKINKLLESDND